MFVGETGVARVIQRTCDLMAQAPEGDVRKLGGIPLEVIQRYINEWYSASLDLFGSEDSSNSATFFAAGLKGRWEESKPGRYEDHRCLEGSYTMDVPTEDGGMVRREIPLRRAMNLVLRDAYRDDCEKVVGRWNRIPQKAGLDFRFTLASERFNRHQGVYAGLPFDPSGSLISREAWDAQRDGWLPNAADYAYVRSLMVPCYEAGQYANWIAPPRKGIDNKPVDFRYVQFVRDKNN